MGGMTNTGKSTAELILPSELVDVIQREAKRTRKSVASFLAESVARYQEDKEDLKDIMAAKRKAAAPVKLADAKRVLGLAN